MRILIITNQYPPGSIGSYEMQCLQITRELSLRGHQIRVLTSKGDSNPANLENSARIFRELESFPEDEKAKTSFTQLYRNVRANRRILLGHLERFAPEAIMIWGMEGLTLSLAVSAERSEIPCLFAVMDPWLAKVCEEDPWLRYWTNNEIDPPLVRTMLRGLRLDQAIHAQAPCDDVRSLRLDNIFFCSESLKSQTSEACGLSLEHAVVVPCGIAPDEIRQRDPATPAAGRILYVARLSEEKDPLTAIRAIQELRQRGYSDFTLDIYGRGTPQFEASLHDYVRRYQINGAISFKPFLEEQVRTALHMYDILVFTSKYPEPFPLMHLKAMAARVPVISTPDGGSGELIRDGENGFLFETGNHYDLAAKIEFLTKNPEIAAHTVEVAYEEAVQYYNFDRVTSHIEGLLYRALESRDLATA